MNALTAFALAEDGRRVYRKEAKRLRLRIDFLEASIRKAEYGGFSSGNDCPWCCADFSEEHSNGCPVFTPKGAIRR